MMFQDLVASAKFSIRGRTSMLRLANQGNT